MQMSNEKKYSKRCEEHSPLWSVIHTLGPWSMVSPLDHDPESLLDQVYGGLPI